MDYKIMTAPCGLDCFNCPMYKALTDDKLREELARQMNLPIHSVMCKGCRNEDGKIKFMKMTEPCNVYRCTQEKGIQFCSECQSFPCDYLHPYADKATVVPHNTKIFNLCLIKKMGLEKWAKEKAKDVKNTYFKSIFKI